MKTLKWREKKKLNRVGQAKRGRFKKRKVVKWDWAGQICDRIKLHPPRHLPSLIKIISYLILNTRHLPTQGTSLRHSPDPHITCCVLTTRPKPWRQYCELFSSKVFLGKNLKSNDVSDLPKNSLSKKKNTVLPKV